MTANYILIIAHQHDGENHVGFYKYTKEETAWASYRQAIKDLPDALFIHMMTTESMIRMLSRKTYTTITTPPKKPRKTKQTKQTRRTWTIKEAIAAGRIVPDLPMTKKGGK
jgi:hypothetical protein